MSAARAVTRYPIPRHAQSAMCSSCGATDGVSHFATCPHADAHRLPSGDGHAALRCEGVAPSALEEAYVTSIYDLLASVPRARRWADLRREERGEYWVDALDRRVAVADRYVRLVSLGAVMGIRR